MIDPIHTTMRDVRRRLLVLVLVLHTFQEILRGSGDCRLCPIQPYSIDYGHGSARFANFLAGCVRFERLEGAEGAECPR